MSPSVASPLSANGFWAAVLQPGIKNDLTIKLPEGRILRLSNVTIPRGSKGHGCLCTKLNSKLPAFEIVTLDQSKGSGHASLDLFFTNTVVLSNTGNTPLHVSGYTNQDVDISGEEGSNADVAVMQSTASDAERDSDSEDEAMNGKKESSDEGSEDSDEEEEEKETPAKKKENGAQAKVVRTIMDDINNKLQKNDEADSDSGSDSDNDDDNDDGSDSDSDSGSGSDDDDTAAKAAAAKAAAQKAALIKAQAQNKKKASTPSRKRDRDASSGENGKSDSKKQRSTPGKKPKTMKCNGGCSKMFSSDDARSTHMRTKHGKKK